MKLLKRGTKFRIAPYGVCVVSSYDNASNKYIMRVWNSCETFYASKEEIDKKDDKKEMVAKKFSKKL